MDLPRVPGQSSLVIRTSLGSRPGETVQVSVLKQTGEGKWAVGIGGQVYAASSPLPLKPGTTLQAHVVRDGTHTLLKTSEAPAGALRIEMGPPAAGGEVGPGPEAALRTGLSGRSQPPAALTEAFDRRRNADPRLARILSLLAGKGLDVTSPATDLLVDLIEYGGGGQRRRRDPRRERRQAPSEGLPEEGLRVAAAALDADRASLLAVVNHLRTDPRDPVIVPFSFGSDGTAIAGTLRFGLEPGPPDGRSVTVVAYEGAGRVRWCFRLSPDGAPSEGRRGVRVSLACDDPGRRGQAEEQLAALRAKLRNLGASVDDTLVDGSDPDGGSRFDGFSSAPDSVPKMGIDTLG